MVTGKFLKRAVTAGFLLLVGCVHPEDSGVQVIVGAKLEAFPGDAAPVEHSVVVVADGKFQAVGAQSSTPVPIGAKMTQGLGMTIEPVSAADPIEVGRPGESRSSRAIVIESCAAGVWVQVSL